MPAPGQHFGEIAGLADVEHDDRNIVVAAERDGGGVHDLQIVAQNLVEAHRLIALGVGDLLRVRGVDAVDAGALEQGVAAHFGGTKRGRGIGGEVGIAGSGGEQDDAPLLDVAKRAAADVGLADAGHGDRRLHPRLGAQLLERALEREGVHDGGQHPHVIGAGPVEALGRGGHAAKDVAAADDETQLGAMLARGEYFAGERLDGVGVDAELAGTHQGLARQLEQNAVEAWSGHLSFRPAGKGARTLVVRFGAAKAQWDCGGEPAGWTAERSPNTRPPPWTP